jgi:hypothetical protein
MGEGVLAFTLILVIGGAFFAWLKWAAIPGKNLPKFGQTSV